MRKSLTLLYAIAVTIAFFVILALSVGADWIEPGP
jgi:hypothetical protein